MSRCERCAEARHALLAALSGAVSAVTAMSLFVAGLFYFDFYGLGTLLLQAAEGPPFWIFLWLPALFGTIGFAIGPTVAGSPQGRPDD